MEGAPMEEDFDAFVNILRVSLCESMNRFISSLIKWSFFGVDFLSGLCLNAPLKY